MRTLAFFGRDHADHSHIIIANASSPRPRQVKREPERVEGALSFQGRASVLAAEGDGKQRRFEIVGYTGEPLVQDWWDAPVVLDLDGIDAGDGRLPILDDHMPVRGFWVGQSETAKMENGQFVLRGPLFMEEEATRDICRLADQGASWQASIGARVLQKDFIAEGNSVHVNGRDYDGPVYVARKTVIRETSFVVIGADRHTSALVASGANKVQAKAATFGEYCKTHGFKEDDLTESQKAFLMRAYDESDDDDDDDDKGGKEPKPANDSKSSGKLDLKGVMADLRREITAGLREELTAQATREQTRIAGIRDVCAKAPGLEIEVEAGGTKKRVPLVEHAIAAGWDEGRTALEAIRAGRPQPAGPHWYSVSTPDLSEAVVEAAVFQQSGSNGLQLFSDDFYFSGRGEQRYRKNPENQQRAIQAELNARYTDRVMQAAHTRFKGRISLHEVLAACCALNGRPISPLIRDDGDVTAMLHAAFRGMDIRADGGSTVSIQNVLANVLNKYLLQGYMYNETTYRELCDVIPVRDFKPTKSINVFGDFTFLKVGDDGQLKDAAMTDEAFANAIETFGRRLQLTRKTIINDDLNALTRSPLLMGQGCSEAVNITFWTLWLSPGNWTDGNAFWFNRTATANLLGGGAINTNLISGASSALTSAALQTAEQTYLKQVRPNGQPVGLDLQILLHPPELNQVAIELMIGEYLVGTGQTSNSRQPNTNIWKGRFRRLMSRYLSNSTYTGFSTTAWWVLANPLICPAIQIAFLNGQETPTVQTAQANFDTLGIQMRGFFDFGCAMQNPRCGVKSAGA